MSKLRVAGIIITIVAIFLWALTCSSTSCNFLSCSSVDKVKYEVTGTAERANISISNAEGGYEQFNDARIPWDRTYSNYTDDFVYISAQNAGEDGSIVVRIYVNDQVLKSSMATGAFAIASASGGKR